MKKIVCFHLFNDYSGSPKVLKMALEGLLAKGYAVDLVTSRGGVLDELHGKGNIRFSTYPYKFSKNSVLTALRYWAVQVYVFFLAFRYLFRRDVVFYVNTLLPVGAALAGRLTGKRVVYHYHENAFVKGAFYKMLAGCMQRLAHEIVCVSQYQASFLRRKKNVSVVPNTLPQEVVARLVARPQEAFCRKRVLLLGSLKLYKGALEFVELATRLPEFRFEMVLNDTGENIRKFVQTHNLSVGANLTIHPRQTDVVPFYNRASLVLNLTNKDMAGETFGLTALEAMAAGLPVIGPTVGGIAERVDDGGNGYKLDVQDLDKIAERISTMLSDESLYLALANNALARSREYDVEEMIKALETRLFA